MISDQYEQPYIDDPVPQLGAWVYTEQDLTSDRGRIVEIDDFTLTVDFFDWIERFPLTSVRAHFVQYTCVLCADQVGDVLIRFGQFPPELAEEY